MTAGGAGRRPGVHDHDAVVAHLHADVAAGADDDEEIGADIQDLEAARRRRAWSLRRRAQRCDGTAIDDTERRARSDGNGHSGTQAPHARKCSPKWIESGCHMTDSPSRQDFTALLLKWRPARRKRSIAWFPWSTRS